MSQSITSETGYMRGLIPVKYKDQDHIGINLMRANELSDILSELPKYIRIGINGRIKQLKTNSEKTIFAVKKIKQINHLRSKVDFNMMNATDVEITIAASKLAKNFHITQFSNSSMSIKKIFELFYSGFPIPSLNKNDLVKINSNEILLEKFWVQKIKKKIIQNREVLASKLGITGKNGLKFVTNSAVTEFKVATKKEEYFSQNNVVFNVKTRAYFRLSDCKSQRDHRYAETVCFLNGLNRYSIAQDYAAVFITITVPAKLHISKQNNALTPTEIQKYLLARWNKYSNKTSEWVTPAYYFRVVEPHDDGTPHWHIMAFFPKNKLANHRKSLLNAFQLEDFESNLVDWKVLRSSIEKSKVVGYLLKKIHRNFESSTGIKYNNISARNHAYMKVWGLRSHAFIGLPQNTKTFWRELRSNNYSNLPFRLRLVKRKVLKNKFSDYFGFFLKNEKNVGIIKVDTKSQKSKKIAGIIWKNKEYLSTKMEYKIITESEALSVIEEKNDELRLNKPSITMFNKIANNLSKVKPFIKNVFDKPGYVLKRMLTPVIAITAKKDVLNTNISPAGATIQEEKHASLDEEMNDIFPYGLIP